MPWFGGVSTNGMPLVCFHYIRKVPIRHHLPNLKKKKKFKLGLYGEKSLTQALILIITPTTQGF